MTTYQYTDTSKSFVLVFDDDGVCRKSIAVGLVPDGVIVLPAKQMADVPQVSRYKGRLYLLQAGLLAAVESWVTDPKTDRAVQIGYQDAEVWRADHAFIRAAQQRFGWTDVQIAQMFADAEQLT